MVSQAQPPCLKKKLDFIPPGPDINHRTNMMSSHLFLSYKEIPGEATSIQEYIQQTEQRILLKGKEAYLEQGLFHCLYHR